MPACKAAAAGAYTSIWHGTAYPRIQIRTAGDIVHGKRIEMTALRGVTQHTPAPAPGVAARGS
ncbi:MAG: hypothetical protein VW450_03450 [Chloroflexota bacterium]